MSPTLAIGIAVGLPLFGALFIALNDRYPNLRETVTIVIAVCLFLVVASLAPHVAAGARPELMMFEVMPGLPLGFRVEPLGVLFALVASGLWIVTSFYSIGYMRGHNEAKQTRFYVCFAIALSAAVGVAFSANLLTLFLFYEVLTLSTYPLVVHHETPEALRAGRVYLGLLIGSSIALFLVAIIATWFLAGTLDFRPGGILAGKVEGAGAGLLLFLYMFGVGKAALMPIHRWLPAAMVAPTPVSALLHAVAVVKAGVFTVTKIIVYVFGIDLLAGMTQDDWLMYVAAFTLLAASCVALTKDNLKARLAYSTISQLSYIILGAALATAYGVIGAGMHIAMHAFGKITLFFCAGAILVATHKTEVSEMDGLGRTMPFTYFAFLIGALSVIGLPPMGGAWSKWYLMLGAMEAEHVLFAVVLMVSSLLNIAYLMPVVARGYFCPARPVKAKAYISVGAAAAPPHGPGAPGGSCGAPTGIHEAPGFCLFAMAISAVGCIVLFFYAEPIYRLLEPIVRAAP